MLKQFAFLLATYLIFPVIVLAEPVQPPPPPSSVPIPCSNYNGYGFSIQQDLKSGQNSSCVSLTKLFGDTEVGLSYSSNNTIGLGIGLKVFGVNTGVGYTTSPTSSILKFQIYGQW